VLGGTEYMEAIIDALSECQIVLLIFSRKANDSPQVRREIERAVSKEKIIVPFRIENVLPTRAMEFALSNTHWLDALIPPREHRLAELNATISRLLQEQPGVAPLWQMLPPAPVPQAPPLPPRPTFKPVAVMTPPIPENKLTENRTRSGWFLRTVKVIFLVILLLVLIVFIFLRGHHPH
jgi:hypothetical protein